MPKMKRTSVYVEGFSHKNPIPAACRIGPLVMSGSIQGRDPATGKLGDTLDRQCALMLSNLQRIIEAAGGGLDDVVKVTVWMADREKRGALNGPWLSMFPDETARPARHTIEMPLAGGKLVECDFTAYIEQGYTP